MFFKLSNIIAGMNSFFNMYFLPDLEEFQLGSGIAVYYSENVLRISSVILAL